MSEHPSLARPPLPGEAGIGGGAWWASKIETKLEILETRFDRLEASLAKIQEQTKPAVKP